MKKKTLLIAAIFLLCGSVLAQDFNIVEPRITESEYIAKDGETLWGICAKFYNPATPGKVKTLASYNRISPNAPLRREQRLIIPMPLVRTQKQVSVNPTRLNLEQAVIVVLAQLEQSLAEARIYVKMPEKELLANTICNGIESSGYVHRLNGEIAAAVTYLNSAQGWTFIDAPEEISGPSVIVRLDQEYYIRILRATQCRNLYVQLLKPPVKIVPPPPLEEKPPYIAPPPPRIIPPIPVPAPTPPPATVHEKKKCPCEIDVSTGGTWQDYSDGAEDYSPWFYGSFRCRIHTDNKGRIYKLGPFYKWSGWHGHWDDPNHHVPNTFFFRGRNYNPGLEMRVFNSRKMTEWTYRLGYFHFWDSGHMRDAFGLTEKNSRFDAATAEVVYENMSRINQNWWPRWRFGFEYLQQFSEFHSEIRRGTDGTIIFVRTEDDIGGVMAKTGATFYQSDRRIWSITGEAWGKYEIDHDRAAKLSAYVGFLNSSIRIGWQQTFADYGQGFVSGTGPSWQFHFHEFMQFVRSGGFKSIRGKEESRFYENPWGE